MKYYARFENTPESLVGPTLGPFKEFFQQTYGLLRGGPDGQEFAELDGAHYWRILPEGKPYSNHPDISGKWTDVIMYAEAHD